MKIWYFEIMMYLLGKPVVYKAHKVCKVYKWKLLRVFRAPLPVQTIPEGHFLTCLFKRNGIP